jgi:Na+/H+ antiporter NhaD/arsenite permease-like protein
LSPHDAIPLGLSLPLWSALPFAGLLLAIALLPIFASRFWMHHYGKVFLAFGLPVAGYLLVHAPRELLHAGLEYVSFIVLLASLFTISGGILIRGTIRATPGANCGFLAAGALLSNLLGTAGASMLLIRPLLRANAGRNRVSHVVIFFIFIVANIGGSLTAIGDPPLFLGYLKGVPFFWTFLHLAPMWVAACGTVLGIFYLADRRAFALERFIAEESGTFSGESSSQGAKKEPFSIEGKFNLVLLGAVIAAVFAPTPWRETVMVAAAVASVWKTPAGIREENRFTYHPIEEMAILFAGIFATMIPALLILKARGGELGAPDPSHFFWATGLLSGFLDKAPVYLAFFSLAQGVGGPDLVAGVSTPFLLAISAGSVFLGAISYIGNAPNFMVKAIAEEAGIRMPSFFGYMAWSCAVLLPLFALLALVFL